VLDQAAEPYRRLANLLIKFMGAEAYLRRKSIAKRLERLLA
jgi:hypothetical protein